MKKDRKYKKAMKIDDQKLDNVAGGAELPDSFYCPSCGCHSTYCNRTGNTETRYLVFTYYEWVCQLCKYTFWNRWETR